MLKKVLHFLSLCSFLCCKAALPSFWLKPPRIAKWQWITKLQLCRTAWAQAADFPHLLEVVGTCVHAQKPTTCVHMRLWFLPGLFLNRNVEEGCGRELSSALKCLGAAKLCCHWLIFSHQNLRTVTLICIKKPLPLPCDFEIRPVCTVLNCGSTGHFLSNHIQGLYDFYRTTAACALYFHCRNLLPSTIYICKWKFCELLCTSFHVSVGVG